jgi:hypothetical protein
LDIARQAFGDYPRVQFWPHDFRQPEISRALTYGNGQIVKGVTKFDWAVCCSIKPMVVRNAGEELWYEIEANIRRVARKILLLGYDDLDDEEGVI